MFLHAVDDLGRTVDVGLGAADVQVRLAGGDLHAERPAQQTQMAVGGAEKLELLARIQLYSYFQNRFSLQRYPTCSSVDLPYATIAKNRYAHGAANSGESITSNIPPKPGTRFEESFC